jgi:hypothetical protein
MKDGGSRETDEEKGEREREEIRSEALDSQLEGSISFLFRQEFFRIASDRADVILIALLAT